MQFFISACSGSLCLPAFLAGFVFSIISFATNLQAEELTSALNLKMQYLNQNQGVISKNLANANTPKYKALELQELKHGARNSYNVRLMTTSPMHISGNNYGSSFKTIKQKDVYETAPNGNNVSIEEQMVKMSQNNTDHQEVTGLLKKLNSISAFATSGN